MSSEVLHLLPGTFTLLAAAVRFLQWFIPFSKYFCSSVCQLKTILSASFCDQPQLSCGWQQRSCALTSFSCVPLRVLAQQILILVIVTVWTCSHSVSTCTLSPCLSCVMLRRAVSLTACLTHELCDWYIGLFSRLQILDSHCAISPFVWSYQDQPRGSTPAAPHQTCPLTMPPCHCTSRLRQMQGACVHVWIE